MRNFQYEPYYKKLLTADIVALIAQIHERKGYHQKVSDAKADTFTKLAEIAKIQSTEASNRIEGIQTSDDRLKKIVCDKTTPKNRDEREIAGYRDVLNTIHESYQYIDPRPSYILQLHRNLYRYSGMAIGGSYKNVDNFIGEMDAEGNQYVRFQPVPAWETPEAMERLCQSFQRALGNAELDQLLLIPMFILDFLCIHPFCDGNGRMSRLLTLLLLYRAGYNVGKYISLEKLIEQSKETYYETLQESSTGWHEAENDYLPYVRYQLGIILAAYRELGERTSFLQFDGISKPDRVRETIQNTVGKITKSEITEKCPGISQVTIERALSDMLKSGEILKIGGGRYTAYVWNREKT